MVEMLIEVKMKMKMRACPWAQAADCAAFENAQNVVSASCSAPFVQNAVSASCSAPVAAPGTRVCDQSAWSRSQKRWVSAMPQLHVAAALVCVPERALSRAAAQTLASHYRGCCKYSMHYALLLRVANCKILANRARGRIQIED